MNKRFKIFLLISLVVIVVGGVFFFTAGFNKGVDFKGGAELKIYMPSDFKTGDIEKIASEAGAVLKSVQKEGNARAYSAAILMEDTYDAQEMSELKDRIVEMVAAQYPGAVYAEYQMLGPAFLNDTIPSAFLALAICLVFTFVYLIFRHKLAGSVTCIVMLIHDILLFFALVLIFGLKVNNPFLYVALAVAAYSIYCSVGLCNLRVEIRRDYAALESGEKKNASLESMAARAAEKRILFTSAIFAVLLVAFSILGTPNLREIAMPLLIGVVVCTYSSLFITLPLREAISKNMQKDA